MCPRIDDTATMLKKTLPIMCCMRDKIQGMPVQNVDKRVQNVKACHAITIEGTTPSSSTRWQRAFVVERRNGRSMARKGVVVKERLLLCRSPGPVITKQGRRFAEGVPSQTPTKTAGSPEARGSRRGRVADDSHPITQLMCINPCREEGAWMRRRN